VKKLIYDKIKEICKKKGISVTCLEKQAGLSNGAISKWNNSSPTADNLQAVAKVLEVKLDELVGKTEA
jgi:transcriptional regulator with XRE-family HTH domain